MEQTIRRLRDFILQTLKDQHAGIGGFSCDVPVSQTAKHSAGGDLAWSSLLLRNDTVDIWLEFRPAEADNAQAVILRERSFGRIRLILNDWANIAEFGFDIQISKQELFDKVARSLPEGQHGYTLENAPGAFRNSIGHVLALYISDTGENWNIGANFNEAQFRNTSSGLVPNVTAALKDLLTAAEYYVNNRDQLLSGQM